MSIARTYKPKAFGNYSVMVERFNSADEIVQVSSQRKLRANYKDERKRINMNFHGLDSWDEAINMLQYGYTPVVDKMRAKINLTAKGNGVKTAFRNDVVGFAPVVPLAMIGVPNCMINTYRKPVNNKVVNVYFDKVAYYDRSVEEIQDACIRLLSAIVNIEMQGYRINLYITEAHTSGHYVDMMYLKVKDANTPLDLQRISFPLTHTAFFRAIGFDWFKRCPTARITDMGLGHTMSRDFTREQITEAFEEIFRERCVVFELDQIISMNEQHIEEVITLANKRYA